MLIIGISEGLPLSLLREEAAKHGVVQGVKMHKDPKTKGFLGAATITYTRAGDGKKAACALDQSIVRGCYLKADLDDKGMFSLLCTCTSV